MNAEPSSSRRPATLVLVWRMLCLSCILTVSAMAQSEPQFERLDLRVLASGTESRVVIDRGSRDGVEVGDRVRFHPREGSTVQGRVTRVDVRSATVEVKDVGRLPPDGTRGVVLIPKERFASQEPPPTSETTQPKPPVEESADPEEVASEEDRGPIRWEDDGSRYSPGSPLLSEVDAVLPSERARLYDGRWYVWGDARGTLDERSDFLMRVGTDLRLTNPFRYGGEMHISLDANYRDVDVPDFDDDDGGQLRFERLSYTRGGTRFGSERVEFGRFLQNGMPEFGVLDGYEWGTQTRDGHRWGYSFGWMPEPNADYESFEDFQLAAFYQRNLDEDERFTAAAGFQKTFHHTAADRDLLVTRLRYLPDDPHGWSYFATAWIDFYGSSKTKDFVELTQLVASASRREDSGASLAVTLTHHQFPDLERNEFLPVTAAQLLDDRSDRLTASTERPLSRKSRWKGLVGVWNDEDDTGGDVELGIERDAFFARRDRVDLTAYLSAGAFSTTAGAWLSYGRSLSNGRWDAAYELTSNRNKGFSSAFADLPMHRLRADIEWYWGEGWTLALHGDASLWDEEKSWGAGFYLQRSIR